jgi:ribosomal protein S18 acetylase RimI-like enzyme
LAHTAPHLHGPAAWAGEERRRLDRAPGRRRGPSARPWREILAQPWGTPELAEQLLDSKVLLGTRAETRFYGVEVDGEVVSWTDLYVAQGIGQIEDVATLAEHRGNGYATAVVLRAVEDARRAGVDLIFLVADDDDWPKGLYRRLGFDTLGRHYKFMTP